MNKILNRATVGVKKIKQKVADTRKLILDSKLQSISCEISDQYEIVMVFPNQPFRDAVYDHLNEIVPNLNLRKLHHRNLDSHVIYLTAPYSILLQHAEEMNLKKMVLKEFGGGYREFTLDELDLFEHVTDHTKFFSSLERQTILKHILDSIKVKDESLDLCGVQMFHSQRLIGMLLAQRVITQIYPLHDKPGLERLSRQWISSAELYQPLDQIRQYFGVNIALYFAYLQHYTIALVFPTIAGLISYYVVERSNKNFSYLIPIIFNLIYSTIYLEHWKRTSNTLTYKWGTLDYAPDLLKQPRAEFKGEVSTCEATQRRTIHYPNWKRFCIIAGISMPVISLFLASVICFTVFIYEYQLILDSYLARGYAIKVLTYLPKSILAVFLIVMDMFYQKASVWLNNLENHRLEETYRNFLIGKLIIFQFVNFFFPMLYIAFGLRDLNQLKQQLYTVLIIRQIVGNLKEIGIPYFTMQFRQVKIKLENSKLVERSVEAGIDTEVVEKSGIIEVENSLERYDENTQAETGQVEKAIEKEEKDRKEMTTEISQNSEVNTAKITEYKRNDDNETEKQKQNSDETGSEEMTERISMPENEEVRNELRHRETNFDGSNFVAQTRSNTDCNAPTNKIEISIKQSEKESTMMKYEDPFEDFLEMFIQFGYVSMFACVFPLASLFCLINNVFEIRSDAFKLVHAFQRPFGRNVANIGVWQIALEGISCASVLVNVLMLYTSGSLQMIFPNLSNSQLIFLVFFIEHMILLIKFLFAVAIPDVPKYIKDEIDLINYKRRNALKTLEKSQRQK